MGHCRAAKGTTGFLPLYPATFGTACQHAWAGEDDRALERLQRSMTTRTYNVGVHTTKPLSPRPSSVAQRHSNVPYIRCMRPAQSNHPIHNNMYVAGRSCRENGALRQGQWPPPTGGAFVSPREGPEGQVHSERRRIPGGSNFVPCTGCIGKMCPPPTSNFILSYTPRIRTYSRFVLLAVKAHRLHGEPTIIKMFDLHASPLPPPSPLQKQGFQCR